MKYRLYLSIPLLFLLLSPWAGADPLKILLTAGVEEKYTDNVFLDEEDERDDYITLISPGIAAGWEAEYTRFRVTGKADVSRYHEHEDLDAVDQSYKASLSHQWNERFSGTLAAGVLVDESRERELDETGLLFNNDKRRRQTYDLGTRTTLSELSALECSYGFTAERFEQTDTYDLEAHRVQVLMTRSMAQILDRSQGRLKWVGGIYDYERDYETWFPVKGFYTVNVKDRQRVQYYAVSLGMDYPWTERIHVTADAGSYLTRTELSVKSTIDPVSGIILPETEEDSHETGYVVSLEAVFTHENGRWALLANHDLVPSSGRNGATKRTTVQVLFHQRFLEKWQLHFGTGSNWNTSETNRIDGVNEDERTFSLNAGVRYDLSLNWQFGVHGNSYRIHDMDSDQTKTQNSAALAVQWNFPVKE